MSPLTNIGGSEAFAGTALRAGERSDQETQ
jgi:hypothetical protein